MYFFTLILRRLIVWYVRECHTNHCVFQITFTWLLRFVKECNNIILFLLRN